MLFQFILLFSLALSETCTRHPVVIVPGIMASMLNAVVHIPDDVDFCDRKLACDRNKDEFRLWLSLKDGIPYMNDCQMAYLTCHYNETSGLMENVEGVNIYPPDFGSTYAVDEICPSIPLKRFTRAFHEIIKGLETIGYVDKVDLFSAPYDWRYYHHDDYLENTKKLIEEAYNKNQQKVVILSHSMGGMTTYILLDYFGKEFCDKYILRWIAMSTPFIGTGIANDVALGGYNMGYPVSKELIKKTARTFEALVMMAPIGGYWNSSDVLVEMGDGTTYTADTLWELYEQIDLMKPFAKKALQESFKPFLDKWESKVPFDVEMHCAITSGLETSGKITFKGDIDSDFTIDTVDGDEEVAINSLEYCKMMTSNFTNLGKYNHQGMLLEKVTVDYVKNLACF
ncbi:1-O-acylceramide synthase precursor, putative [Entamoeba invadens IP1]|uniref:1-O-acylceramide synthase, putative n=2 Tax=Entamoeba invadens TaxID=33085 RepID=A0A0A1TXK3_ENTIV|nr:1-O-acylceramide synthase precursor, putative [Entamoeba invadens IP1]BAN40718.1 1-O-acylceramide synthase precursor, putative [Entamoeba invadens]ELP86080.1 1-O-acylceramide synthase precursor, putative [Entamoeba invadens IP1]BAN41119.1 1-O-acylceramide synthase precursor, putative [Entamoeba invadens]BAN41207.1 1-O-acylceramide synthase precursor, putative [Entamoeba invadens]BAN41215.1 1-O-acylceramide synthase precursor, putative [Entamoeba invadens]|eukprot:XP_004185426.1 1-O-acylceramide synthase precursor, putative [Entamoeba invadens IP1]